MLKSYGIDVSSWQGDIDFTAFAPDFVIIRAGCGQAVDNKAQRNMDELERLGIPYGVYWYSYALTPDAAAREADKCLETIKGRKIGVGVWFDMEDSDNYKASHGALYQANTSAMCRVFCERVEAAGYYTGIYTSLSWLNDGYVSGCEQWDKWVASWGRNDGSESTDTSAYGTLHQYAGDIRQHGINVDLNVCYAPLTRYTGGVTPADPEAPPDTPPEPDIATTPYWPPRMLCLGMTGSDVLALQALLYAHGYNPGGVEGAYDTWTRNAVVACQAEAGLDQDGIAGPKTWAKLLAK